ncbi:unnamed protein product [Closterium sp. NIES-65]|nr:unnamed protein product [Closterium sp. NIES-65]
MSRCANASTWQFYEDGNIVISVKVEFRRAKGLFNNREAELPADTDSAGAVSARPATTLAPLPQHPPVRFNQDPTFFAYATHRGFCVFRCNQLKEILRREFEGRGVGMVEMLFSSSLLALVGGGPNPCYPPNKVRGGEERGVRRSRSPIAEKKVIIWDDKERRYIGELAFCSEVRGVRLRRDHIVFVLEHKILVYSFPGLKLVHQVMPAPGDACSRYHLTSHWQVETLSNPKGLCEICVELFEERRGYVRGASFSQPACMALSLDGKLLATASSKGTIIRVINTADGTRLHELRRGVERANIYSLAFSPKAPFLVAASDRGTVHVFSLGHSHSQAHGQGQGEGQGQAQEDGVGGEGGGGMGRASGSGGGALSSLGLLKGGLFLSFIPPLPKYFSDEPSLMCHSIGMLAALMPSPPCLLPLRDFSTSRSSPGVLPEKYFRERSLAFYRTGVHTHMLAAFGADPNTVIVVGSTGAYMCSYFYGHRYYKLQFDPQAGGEMKLLNQANFLTTEDEH